MGSPPERAASVLVRLYTRRTLPVLPPGPPAERTRKPIGCGGCAPSAETVAATADAASGECWRASLRLGVVAAGPGG